MTALPPGTIPRTVGSGHQTPDPAPDLAPADLSLDGLDVMAMLQRRVRDGAWLDAFLCAAAAGQLVDDALHPDPMSLRRAASFLSTAHGRSGRAAAAILAGTAALVAQRGAGATRALRAQRPDLTRLIDQLASAVVDPTGRPFDAAQVEAHARRCVGVGELVQDVVRLPACFRSFDQHPDDSRWLAQAVTDRYPDLDGPVVVVGLRTSGSYLAPLLAAALRLGGYRQVVVCTYRPGHPLLREERAALRAVALAGGRVLLTDDPPGSGSSLAAAARAVEHAGVDRQAITLVLSLLDGRDELPAPLRGLAAVVQPWSQWSIHRRLAPPAVSAALEHLLEPGTRVLELTRIDDRAQGGHRRHQRARYSVRTVDAEARVETLELAAEGVGLGFLGRHVLTLAHAMDEHVPAVLGVVDGVLLREWLPDGPPRDVVPAIAAYVRARARRLPAQRDPTAGLVGRDPVWEVASELISGGFGPLAPLARTTLLNRLARELLAVEHPVVVDGNTDARHWLVGADGSPRKVDFHERGFSHLELLCYDAALDLAGAAADPPATVTGPALRREYERAGGAAVDAERWLLYRLTQLWRAGRAGDVSPARVRRRSGQAVNDYLAEVLLADTDPPSYGPLCAIDLDGVLETDVLGYPTTSPLGVLVLRALHRHGYRPVLVTGRGMAAALERRATFGLAGAVAEYGAVVATAQDVVARTLCTGPELDRLGDLRAKLAAAPDVEVDPSHTRAIRARYRGGPVPAALLASVGLTVDAALRVVHGQGQTDIVPGTVDKGTGLAHLDALLGSPGCVLAVGDTGADLAMFARAALARAPRNADAAVRAAGITRTRHSYQAGLSDACADLLGHRPGGCPQCAVPALPRRTRGLLTVLGLRQDGLRSVPGAACRLARLMKGGRAW